MCAYCVPTPEQHHNHPNKWRPVTLQLENPVLNYTKLMSTEECFVFRIRVLVRDVFNYI